MAQQIAERQNTLDQHDQRSATPTMQRANWSPRKIGPTPLQRAEAFQAWVLNANDLTVPAANQQAAADCGFNYRQRMVDIRIETRSPIQGFEMFSVQNGRTDWNAWEQKRALREKYEGRDMDTATPTEGAEFVPQLFQYELERAMLAYGGFRRICRVMPTAGGNPLLWPTVDDTSNAATIVGEGLDVGSEALPTTGDIQFGAYKFSSAPVLVTAELLEDSAFNMAVLLGSLLGERIGRGEAGYFATGTGTAQPQGCATGSVKGADAAVSALTGDNLIDLQTSIDPAYEGLPSVGFAFNKATLGEIRKLKEATDGQYLWQPGLRLGEPDLLLGSSYTIIQELDDIGVSTRPVLYGAFEKFVIRDVATLRLYRLEELYRANDHTGFLALHRTDSKILQPNAIKHILNAAS